MIIPKNKLLISEDFYSIQGEGISTGIPAYFIRLTNCNINCGLNIRTLNKIKRGEIEVSPNTILEKDIPEATWICDSIPVWYRGIEREFSYLTEKWKNENIYEDIISGLIHLVWTGGEPCLHQESILEFIKQVLKVHYFNTDKVPSLFHEIETNGTLLFKDELFKTIHQINCSPKLSNSGMFERQRIKTDVIQQISTHKRYQFKFVISTESDIEEMFDTYITPNKLNLRNVVCMPGLDNQEDFFERTKWVLEMSKKYKFIGMSRLHIAAWGQVVGV